MSFRCLFGLNFEDEGANTVAIAVDVKGTLFINGDKFSEVIMNSVHHIS